VLVQPGIKAKDYIPKFDIRNLFCKFQNSQSMTKGLLPEKFEGASIELVAYLKGEMPLFAVIANILGDSNCQCA
jgi:hypothetical protein